MIRRDFRKPSEVRFLTYDLEWYPETYVERLVGVFDGARYRQYRNTDEFLSAELCRKNRGVIFFAHAGGLADVQFVFRSFIQRRNRAYKLDACFSGSSAIIVRITQGKNAWLFCDSYWLLRDSLARIGESVALEKGGKGYRCPDYPSCGHEEEHCIFYSPIGLLRDYNALDCRILWIAIDRMQRQLMALGGELHSTIASSALALYRTSFLNESVDTDTRLNAVFREAYIASRVEVFERECGVAHYYDFNSSFPHSMTAPQPGSVCSHGRVYREGALAMIDADVTVFDCAIPPLPMRVDDRPYFATGNFRRWFDSADLELLLETGGRINRVHEVYEFRATDSLSRYVWTLYELRRTETDSFLRLVYKYLLNSLYGKFGEGNNKQRVVVSYKRRPQADSVFALGPGIYLCGTAVEIAHAHVPIAAHVTALSRSLITRALRDADQSYYCDTDSMVTTSLLPTSDVLGELKLEREITSATFLAPKLYRLFPGPEIKAKGFPKLTTDAFDRLRAGDPHEFTRMVRLRENLKAGCCDPHDERVTKRIISHLSLDELDELGIARHRATKPKRCFLSDGTSRPWKINELIRE